MSLRLEEGQDPDWMAEFPERPPPTRRLPRLWSLPLQMVTHGEGLFELVTEYVHRKLIVWRT